MVITNAFIDPKTMGTTTVIPGSIIVTDNTSPIEPSTNTVTSTGLTLGQIPEYVDRSEFGEDEACETCPHALSCMAGSMPEQVRVASTKQEQIDGDTLPCVEDGTVRLVLLEEPIAYYVDYVGTTGSDITIEEAG